MVAPNDGNTDTDGANTQAQPDRADTAEKPLPKTVVRYGLMGYIGEFTHKSNLQFTCGASLIVQTNRGIEMGTHLSLTCPKRTVSVPRDAMDEYVANSGPDTLRFNAGKILREAATDDIMEEKRLAALAPERMSFCKDAIEKHNLPMKLITCENLLGGERVIFYFLADGRVDFRELVKDLAREFQTRIEMRQIGARDEARLVADYETCGRQCCCKNFLKTLKPVSMKMAKLQKATLDPSKVSGRCGRLKCCLRYEHESYEQLVKNLPKIGSRISTAQGTGTVVDRQILTQLVRYHSEDGRLITVAVEDVIEKDLPRPTSDRDKHRPDTDPAEPESNSIAGPNDSAPADQNDTRNHGRRTRRRRKPRNDTKDTPED